MTSLVTDVLFSAGELAKDDISSKVEKLRRKIEDIKMELQESLKHRYIDFIPQYIKLDKLTGNLNSATNEYDVLFYQIEKEIKPQMSGSVAEFHAMLDDLKRINILKNAVSNLVEMHKHLEDAKSALVQKSYLSATESLSKFESAFNITSDDCQKDIEIYFSLKTEFFVTKENIIYQLQEAWKRKVSICQTEGNKRCKNKIILSLHSTPIEETTDILQSLELLGHLKNVLKTFGKQFLNLICKPLVSQITEVEVLGDNENASLTLFVLNEELPEPSKVFQYFIDIFNFLHLYFFKLSVVLNEKVDSENNETAMEKFGGLFYEEFCTLLVEKCIKLAVPSQSKDLETFQKAINQAVNLQNLLVELGFFKSQDNPLMQFIHNVDELPANKMAQDILGRARNLMEQNLYQTVPVGAEEASNFLCTTVVEVTGDLNQMARTKSGLSKASFAFPSCQISVFAKNLVKLLHEVMQEAESTASGYSLRLFYTARNICELYCCVVPAYHKEEIANIPQQAAIHHNNCMYISHSLLTLGAQYKLHSPLPVAFVDLVPEIRRIGAEAFLAQMRHQRQQLLQLLQEPEAFQNIASDEGLLNKAEKSVRQCLCQLQLLKQVWSDVLPAEVYFKAIGTLVNTCLEEIILHITSMEDIAAQTASQLDSVFGIVLKQAPELFKVTRANKCDLVHKYIRKWFKFQELQLILSASMREIVDRWSSGKGPLASHFTVEEVKHLIRALFQNTERRAAALGKIR